ncbi:DUF4345 domain-containing protein [Nocardia sp. NPDC057668]|uniref:DUF4345 domain-containing protein n=1 Tax=Nocardia sp. NPDC057668 TaxID=3346202 RepID=UPI00366FCAAF
MNATAEISTNDTAPARSHAALRWMSLIVGYACVAIGLAHLVLGEAAVPDMGTAAATPDSQSRFFGAIFVGYGLAWIWSVRGPIIDTRAVRWLAGIFLLGAVGRFISMAVHGWPHPFILVLTALEVLIPPLFIWLAVLEQRRVATTPIGR